MNLLIHAAFQGDLIIDGHTTLPRCIPPGQFALSICADRSPEAMPRSSWKVRARAPRLIAPVILRVTRAIPSGR